MSLFLIWLVVAALIAPSVLLGHVTHIVSMRAKPQMVRPAARRIVAYVQYLHAIWNVAMFHFPSESVSVFYPPPHAKQAVTLLGLLASPYPAIASLVQFLIKALTNTGLRCVVAMNVTLLTAAGRIVEQLTAPAGAMLWRWEAAGMTVGKSLPCLALMTTPASAKIRGFGGLMASFVPAGFAAIAAILRLVGNKPRTTYGADMFNASNAKRHGRLRTHGEPPFAVPCLRLFQQRGGFRVPIIALPA